ncbi:MAG: hypothetical protein PUP93_24845 [Rhizonema sp. NSF051]|nr:hypothetical protein [Rhizonema sp. NSF051]
MYATVCKDEEKRLVGRPKRDDKTERANLKLNSEIRKILKTLAIMNGRSESSQVERLIIESEALNRFLKKNPEIAAKLLPGFNEEVSDVFNETVSDD